VTGSCASGNEHLDCPKMGEISWMPQQTLAFKKGSAPWKYVVS
jgi:hypothetical protein